MGVHVCLEGARMAPIKRGALIQRNRVRANEAASLRLLKLLPARSIRIGRLVISGGGMSLERMATLEDARRLLGDIEDHVLVEVLALAPTLEVLKRAVLWERGDGDHDARMSQELNEKEGAIVVLLTSLREEASSDQA
jgi:hypothetical protein